MNRTSPIWKIPIELLRELVSKSNSLAEILRYFGMSAQAGNYITLKKRLSQEKIDFSRFKLGGIHNKGRKFRNKQIPLDSILVENSTYNPGTLKKRLLKGNILVNRCYECGQEPFWNGKPLTLTMDHINGIKTDQRLQNLRILCPHCHSQTETFAGRRLKTFKSCRDCGREVAVKQARCRSCAGKQQPKKFEIKKEDLEKLVWEKPLVEVALIFKVSDTAIKKRCKSFGIKVPGRGYWQKLRRQGLGPSSILGGVKVR